MKRLASLVLLTALGVTVWLATSTLIAVRDASGDQAQRRLSWVIRPGAD